VRRVHVTLHSAFAQAVRWDLLGRNMFDLVRPPKIPQHELHLPSPEAVQKALAEIQITAITRSVTYGPDGLVTKRTKTGKSRTIPVDPATMRYLSKWKASWEAVAPERLDKDSLIFPGRDGKPMHLTSITGKWRNVMARHGLDGVRLHDLRHLHVTTLLDAGVPVAVVSKRVGHSSETVTLSTDAHAVAMRRGRRPR
jgi:integrase